MKSHFVDLRLPRKAGVKICTMRLFKPVNVVEIVTLKDIFRYEQGHVYDVVILVLTIFRSFSILLYLGATSRTFVYSRICNANSRAPTR